MSELLLKLFVPAGSGDDVKVRSACGRLSGVTGIILNILLVAGIVSPQAMVSHLIPQAARVETMFFPGTAALSSLPSR